MSRGGVLPAYRLGVATNAGRRQATMVEVEPTEPVDVMLEECALAYGRDLLAYLLGAGAGAPLADWRLENVSNGSVDQLRACYRVFQTFKDGRKAKAWMRHGNAAFGGRSPAWAVRNGDPELLVRVEREAERLAYPL
jgi:hypothetical protein